MIQPHSSPAGLEAPLSFSRNARLRAEAAALQQLTQTVSPASASVYAGQVRRFQRWHEKLMQREWPPALSTLTDYEDYLRSCGTSPPAAKTAAGTVYRWLQALHECAGDEHLVPGGSEIQPPAIAKTASPEALILAALGLPGLESVTHSSYEKEGATTGARSRAVALRRAALLRDNLRRLVRDLDLDPTADGRLAT
jgi:hypothetical protein